MRPLGVSLEWIGNGKKVGILRLHANVHQRYGDPYIWSCTVVRKGDTIELKGAVSAPPAKGREAFRRLFKRLGITIVKWERRTGRTRPVLFVI